MVDTNELRAAIEAAEHKPQDWNVSVLTFGAAAKRIDYPPGEASPLAPWGEEIIGTFPWKRDGWLAVAAVRALPTLLDELDRLRELEAKWLALNADCDAQPCRYPCLRDDLYDWECDYARRPLLPAGDGEGGGNGRG